MVYIMGKEPLPNTTPADIRAKYCEKLTEKDLADAFAVSSNQFWWVADNVYDYENDTPEYKTACEITDAWGELMDDYESQIFSILKSEGVIIPQTGQIAVLKPFMMRNGYIDGQGWWIKVPVGMIEALKELSEEQIRFICEECNISKDTLFQMNEEDLQDTIYEAMCDIEVAEVPVSDDEPESERCIIASDIVTILGNALAMAQGDFYNQDDEDCDKDYGK